MKTILLIISLATTYTLYGDGLPNAPYLYAIGKSSKAVAVDQIQLSFSIEAREMEAAIAVTATKEKAQKIFSLLKEFGVERPDITAASISTDIIYDDERGKEFLGYEVVRGFTILLRDVTRYGELAKALLEIPVEGFSLESSNSSREGTVLKELEEESRIAARRNAEVTAASLGTEIIGVYAISPLSFTRLSGQWPHDYSSYNRSSASRRGSGNLLRFVIPPIVLQRESHVIFLIRNIKQSSAPTARAVTSDAKSSDTPSTPETQP